MIRMFLIVAKWLSIVVFAVLLLKGVYDFLRFILISWGIEGAKYTILIASFLVLICLPSLTKDYAPGYHQASILAIYVYVIGFLIYRFTIQK